MSSESSGWVNSLRSSSWDSEKGSARKQVELAARGPFPVNALSVITQATNATGTTYNQIASSACLRMWGDNNSGTSLIFKRHGTTVPTATKTFASGALIDLPCIANANEWDVKRSDDSNTPATLILFGFNVT